MNDIELCQELMKRAEEYQKRKEREFAIAELEKIKAEIEEDKKLYSYNEHIQKGHSNCIDIVNSHISELKGENKP